MIARFRGHDPIGWRDAVRLLAESYGVADAGWRSQLNGIAQALGGGAGTGWRDCVSFIKDYYEEPPTLYRIRSADGYLLRDADNKIIWVRG